MEINTTNNITINYMFIRHGYGCHNAGRNLYKNKDITREQISSLIDINGDPELTNLGIDASLHNGCVLSKTIMNLHKTLNDESLKINNINLVGCSPLIRSMETAYYMTRKWKNPPTKIYVMPHLREIDESGEDKFSELSRIIIDVEPSYAMKSIDEQKKYLESQNILQFFDFQFVEWNERLRKEPGDISNFIQWFMNTILPLTTIENNQLNLFIITHAGVLKSASGLGFVNNSGFLLNTSYKMSNHSASINKIIPFTDYLPSSFFSNYSKYTKTDYFCPSDKCNKLCQLPINIPENRKSIKSQVTCNLRTEEQIDFNDTTLTTF
jgi:hypothetical protein